MRYSGFFASVIWAGVVCAHPPLGLAQQSKGSAPAPEADGKPGDRAGRGKAAPTPTEETDKSPDAQQGAPPAEQPKTEQVTEPGGPAGQPGAAPAEEPGPAGAPSGEQSDSQGAQPAPAEGMRPGQQSGAQPVAPPAEMTGAEATAGEPGATAGGPAAAAGEAGPPQASPPPAPPSKAKPDVCVPECRAGYSCLDGRCVSFCNPPCPPDTSCTAEGVCEPASGAPAAEPPWPASQSRTNVHSELFVRFTCGPTWGYATRDTGQDVRADGLGLTGALDIGGAIVENFILHARLSGRTIYDPIVQVDDGDRDRASEDFFAFRMLGGGATYYVMPINLYGTLVFGFSWSDNDIEALEQPVEYKTGFGLEADVGKEWWVSAEWGLGVAARLAYNTVSPESSAQTDNPLSGLGVALLVSATFN